MKITVGDPEIELLVDNAGYLLTLRMECRSVERGPHLKRLDGTEDLLTAIVQPRT